MNHLSVFVGISLNPRLCRHSLFIYFITKTFKANSLKKKKRKKSLYLWRRIRAITDGPRDNFIQSRTSLQKLYGNTRECDIRKRRQDGRRDGGSGGGESTPEQLSMAGSLTEAREGKGWRRNNRAWHR